MNYDDFEKTLKLGEKLFKIEGISHKDAFDFACRNYYEMPINFISFINNDKRFLKGNYEYSLIKYFFMKTIENRVSSDIYSNTDRGNVCDCLYAPYDIFLDKYPTNLPLQLEEVLYSYYGLADKYAALIQDEIKKDDNYQISEDILAAVTIIAQGIGREISEQNNLLYNYPCSEMLTRNELNNFAGSNFCNLLNSRGAEIIETNFSRDTYQNIVFKKNNSTYFMLISAEIAPTTPSFRNTDFDELYKTSKENDAIPCYVSISLRSSDENHANDSVILADDEIQIRINSIDELQINSDVKDTSAKYSSRSLLDIL